MLSNCSLTIPSSLVALDSIWYLINVLRTKLKPRWTIDWRNEVIGSVKLNIALFALANNRPVRTASWDSFFAKVCGS